MGVGNFFYRKSGSSSSDEGGAGAGGKCTARKTGARGESLKHLAHKHGALYSTLVFPVGKCSNLIGRLPSSNY